MLVERCCVECGSARSGKAVRGYFEITEIRTKKKIFGGTVGVIHLLVGGGCSDAGCGSWLPGGFNHIEY